jgi:hypothetical protein
MYFLHFLKIAVHGCPLILLRASCQTNCMWLYRSHTWITSYSLCVRGYFQLELPLVRISVSAICKLHVTRRSKQGSCGKSSLNWRHTSSCFCTLGSLTHLLFMLIIFDCRFVYFFINAFRFYAWEKLKWSPPPAFHILVCFVQTFCTSVQNLQFSLTQICLYILDTCCRLPRAKKHTDD